MIKISKFHVSVDFVFSKCKTIVFRIRGPLLAMYLVWACSNISLDLHPAFPVHEAPSAPSKALFLIDTWKSEEWATWDVLAVSSANQMQFLRLIHALTVIKVTCRSWNCFCIDHIESNSLQLLPIKMQFECTISNSSGIDVSQKMSQCLILGSWAHTRLTFQIHAWHAKVKNHMFSWVAKAVIAIWNVMCGRKRW